MTPDGFVMDYNKTEMRAAAFLSSLGANDTPHGTRTLFQHLQGTWLLLKRHGEREAVCLAGMFHSIYGTNVFKHVTLSAHSLEARAQVQDLIGHEAERLVFLFCTTKDRPGVFFDRVTRSHGQIWRDLQAIELANLIEQGGFSAVVRYM